MVTIDVVWTQATDPEWSSKAIMWGMGKNYSHVSIVGRATNGTEYWCHAVDEGVCYIDPAEYLKTHIIVRKKTVSLNCSRDLLEGFIRGEKGKEYSDSQLCLAGLQDVRLLGKLAILWIGFNGDEKRICSEFVAAVLYNFSDYADDLMKVRGGNLDLITPADLEAVLKPDVLVA